MFRVVAFPLGVLALMILVGFVGNPNVLTWLLGHDPTSLATFARENASV